jgi:hypothetical protein
MQTLVRSGSVVITEVLLEHPPQMSLVQDDQAPQALLSQGANELFHVAIALRPAFGDLEVHHAPARMGQHDEDVESLAADGLHLEPITGPDVAGLGSQEGDPTHRGRVRRAFHVLGDAARRNVDAELAQLSGDTVLSPQ